MKVVRADNGDILNIHHIIRFAKRKWSVNITRNQIIAYDILDKSYLIEDDLSDEVCEDRMKKLNNYLRGVEH